MCSQTPTPSPTNSTSTPSNNSLPSSALTVNMDNIEIINDTSSPTVDANNTPNNAPDTEETPNEDFPPTFSGSTGQTPNPAALYRSSQADRQNGEVNIYIRLLTREQVSGINNSFADMTHPASAVVRNASDDENTFLNQDLEQQERERQRLRILAPVFMEFVMGVVRANMIYRTQKQASGEN